MQHTMCCKNNKDNNYNNYNNNNNNKKKIKNKNKSGFEQFGSSTLHKIRILARLHIHMSFAIAEKPRLPRRFFPLTAMCLSIHLARSLHVTLSINILA